MTSLPLKSRLLVGLTLFSMFFGAGNLIFPPFLGFQAGSATWTAMAGFALTAIAFPVLGVMAVARSGGLDTLAGRVHPVFAAIFTFLIYLSIGPCLAIPRTASTSFEMAVSPFFRGADALTGSWLGLDYGTLAQALYSVVFFLVAGWIALDPGKLTQRLGKILGPTLLTLIAILTLATVFSPLAESYPAPMAHYASDAFFPGFIDGYQTMDTIAALNFGLIIALNIRAFGVKDDNAVVAETLKAGLIAGVLFAIVYGALAWLGMQSVGAGFSAENGAQTLTEVARAQFGALGMVLLGAAFFIACLNTCIGLLSACSNYFKTIFPVLGYKAWLAVFVLTSMVISNAGLTTILKLSIPVLVAIYPVALVLIILGLLHFVLPRLATPYKLPIAITALVSIASAYVMTGLAGAASLGEALKHLPLSDVGLEWFIPALVATVVGYVAVNARACASNAAR